MTDSFPLTTTIVDPDTRHWTPQVQRAFLEALAVEGSVRGACRVAGKSWRTAYTLRMQARGAAFALGWDGAVLIARARLADELMERAFEGQEESMTRSGDTITRHKVDNRLAMSLLSRLDRMAEAPAALGNDTSRARIVAEDFEAFLDLIESGGDRDTALAFITARTPALPAPETAETGAPEQCDLLVETMIKECGGLTVAERAAKMGYWLDEKSNEWRTNFPYPEDFEDKVDQVFGGPEFERDLYPEEMLLLHRAQDRLNAALEQAGHERRAQFLYPQGLSDLEKRAKGLITWGCGWGPIEGTWPVRPRDPHAETPPLTSQ
jgi:hypothetical protein